MRRLHEAEVEFPDGRSNEIRRLNGNAHDLISLPKLFTVYQYTFESEAVDGLFRRRNLPHIDVPGGTYFVTFCLAGSLPATFALRSGMRCAKAPRSRPDPGTPARHRGDAARARFVAMERCLDETPCVTWLAHPRLAEIVQRSLLHGHGSRYHLHAYVVMPSHCHVVFTPFSDCLGRRPAREAILHSVKRHSARQCNQVLARDGVFWQPESYERLVRSAEELARVVAYVERNPVKAGLSLSPEAWRHSSAARGCPHPSLG